MDNSCDPDNGPLPAICSIHFASCAGIYFPWCSGIVNAFIFPATFGQKNAVGLLADMFTSRYPSFSSRLTLIPFLTQFHDAFVVLYTRLLTASFSKAVEILYLAPFEPINVTANVPVFISTF